MLRIETDKGCGSGFFVTANGYAVTNWHVIEGARSITTTTVTQHKSTAAVVAGDPDLDLALLAVGGLSISQAAPSRLGQFRRSAAWDRSSWPWATAPR